MQMNKNINLIHLEKIYAATCGLIKDMAYDGKCFHRLTQIDQKRLASVFLSEMEDEIYCELMSEKITREYLCKLIRDERYAADDLTIEIYNNIIKKYAEFFSDAFDWYHDEMYFASRENRSVYVDEFMEGI